MSSSERLQLKGKLSELKLQRMNLASRINARINAIKNLLATSSVTPIEEINLQNVFVLADDAHTLQLEYIQISDDIRKLEKELE